MGTTVFRGARNRNANHWLLTDLVCGEPWFRLIFYGSFFQRHRCVDFNSWNEFGIRRRRILGRRRWRRVVGLRERIESGTTNWLTMRQFRKYVVINAGLVISSANLAQTL